MRGFDGPDALKLPNGQPVFYQPDAENPNGYLLPFHLDTNASSAQKIPSTSHAWTVQHEAWNGGRMDRCLARQWGFCNLQSLQPRRGFESFSLRHNIFDDLKK